MWNKCVQPGAQRAYKQGYLYTYPLTKKYSVFFHFFVRSLYVAYPPRSTHVFRSVNSSKDTVIPIIHRAYYNYYINK